MQTIPNNIVVEPMFEEDVKIGSIIISLAKAKMLPKGKVVAVGDRVSEVNLGDTVCYNENAVRTFEHEDKIYHQINIHEVYFKYN